MPRSIVLVVVISLTGCSFFLTRGPGDMPHPAPQLPDCTPSMTWPIVDGSIAAVMLLGAASGFKNTNTDTTMPTANDTTSRNEAIGSALMIAAAAGAGAVVGYMRVSSCRDTTTEFYQAHPMPMYPQYPPPYGYAQPQPYGPYTQPPPYAPQPQPQPQQPQPPPAN